MQEPSQKPWGLILGTVVVASVIGGGLAWFAQQNLTQDPITSVTESPSPTETPAITPTLSPTPSETVPTADNGQPSTYWLTTKGTKTDLIAKTFTPGEPESSEAQALEAAFTQLLAGSKDKNFTSTIPKGTKLLGLALKSDGIHIDLSQDFTKGGGAESMISRLGQVLYTATSTQPNADVWISVEGEPLELLGGEGLFVDQPLTREIFEKEY